MKLRSLALVVVGALALIALLTYLYLATHPKVGALPSAEPPLPEGAPYTSRRVPSIESGSNGSGVTKHRNYSESSREPNWSIRMPDLTPEEIRRQKERERQLLLSKPTNPYLPQFPSNQLSTKPLAEEYRGKSDTFNAIDETLSKLPLGNIAFNVPRAMNIDTTTMIQLALGLKTSVDKLKEMIAATGEKVGANIRIADRMEARLSGQGFSITAITPETQAISGTDITKWEWEVTPKREGVQRLHLTLSVLLNVDGASTGRAVRTFDRDIDIQVTLKQRVSAFLVNNWQWLWAVILVPIAGMLWRVIWKNKKRA